MVRPAIGDILRAWTRGARDSRRDAVSII